MLFRTLYQAFIVFTVVSGVMLSHLSFHPQEFFFVSSFHTASVLNHARSAKKACLLKLDFQCIPKNIATRSVVSQLML